MGMSHLKRRKRRRAMFFTEVAMFIVYTVPQPPLNHIFSSLLEVPLNAGSGLLRMK
jgi:hypothetical protein